MRRPVSQPLPAGYGPRFLHEMGALRVAEPGPTATGPCARPSAGHLVPADDVAVLGLGVDDARVAQVGDGDKAVATEDLEPVVVEDAAVHAEREAADDSLRREREETARTLRSLIPFERAKTDRHLLTERALWDDAVSNRDDFLGIVSHDLRGLLSGIVVAAGLLSAKAPAGAEGQYATAQAERIQRYAARLSRLIADLFVVTSIEAGTTDVSKVDKLIGATFTPMTRRLLLEMPITFQGVKLDNIEGLAWGKTLPNGNRTLVLVADNNFTAETQSTQFIVLEVVMQ